MANNDAAVPGNTLPKTEQQVARAIRRLGPSPADSTLQFWRIGEELRQRWPRGVRISTSKLSKESGISERELRYCLNVRDAFGCSQIESLVEQGLRWSTIRELASAGLKDVRGELIGEFESGRLSNAQLLAEAIACRKESLRAKRR